MKDFFKKICFNSSLLQARAEQHLRGLKLQEMQGVKDKKD